MKHCLLLLIFFCYVMNIFAQNQSQSEYRYLWSQTQPQLAKGNKNVIDFSAIDRWVKMKNQNDDLISNDGKYFIYLIENLPYKSHTLVVQSTTNSWQQGFTGADPGFFSEDSKQYIFRVNDSLCFLSLESKKLSIEKNVISYKGQYSNGLNGCNNEWVAYLQKTNEGNLVLKNLLTGTERQFKNIDSYSFEGSSSWLICKEKSSVNRLIVYNLRYGKEYQYNNVTSCIVDKSGKELIIKKNTADSTTLQWVNLQSSESNTIWNSCSNKIELGSISLDAAGQQVAFVVQEKNKGQVIWYYKQGMVQAVVKVNDKTPGIVPGLLILRLATFTDDGKYIRFKLYAPNILLKRRPEAVPLDVWSYRDTTIHSDQSSQLIQKEYLAVINTEEYRVIVLEKEFEKLKRIKGDFAVIGKSGWEKNGDRFWEQSHDSDSNSLVSLKDGSSVFLKTRSIDQYKSFNFSPGGKYLVYFDPDEQCNYFSYDLETGKLTNISVGIPAWQLGTIYGYIRPTENPRDNLQTGIAGWLKGDSGLLVYDNYDVWLLDPSGNQPPVNITNGYGRKRNIKFKLLPGNLTDDLFLTRRSLLWLTALNKQTKYEGFYHKRLNEKGDPSLLSMKPFTFDNIRKARDTNVWIMQCQTAAITPNYFFTTDLKEYKALTNLQPQKHYNWLSAKLISFPQLDGTTSQGILYKPENFDPDRKYPIVFLYYEQMSHRFNQYPVPYFSGDAHINIPWFVSHGYLVFTPDIYFDKGKPGQSALNTVEGAARYLSKLPYVDAQRMGISGHSFGGGLTNYILTHSNMFAAALVGAGVSDRISATLQLGGVDGNLHRGSRLTGSETEVGSSIWEQKKQWIEESSIMYVDQVTSPLLIFHCKADGAVPWQQAVEMFTALRRLEKKVWMLQYDNEGHNLMERNNELDFTIRATQYFDHYLKDAPPPRWMTQGIPAHLKQVEDRLELDAAGNCAMAGKTDCNVCDAWNKQYKRNPSMFDSSATLRMTRPISGWKLDKDIKAELDKKQQ
jgi:dienelactone hydrolase